MKNNKHLADGLISGLKKFTGKLEQLQVDLTLGKAEAKDKLDDYQKSLKHFLRESKLDIQNGTGIIGDIRRDIEELEVQLALGKMEAEDHLNAHKKHLFRTINEIDKKLANELG
jgi:hypothetical protein